MGIEHAIWGMKLSNWCTTEEMGRYVIDNIEVPSLNNVP